MAETIHMIHALIDKAWEEHQRFIHEAVSDGSISPELGRSALDEMGFKDMYWEWYKRKHPDICSDT